MALEPEFEYYLQQQEVLVSQFRDKYIVVRNQKVIGVYDDEMEAIEKTAQQFPLGTFLVQKCGPGAENYTQIFHSPTLPC